MVQLSPSRTIETLTVEKEDGQGSPKSESPRVLTALQLALSPATTTYYGYEKYIEDGLICLKHKIRNIEKKKEAVGKYEEVVHNLKFAKELQKTIGSLTQDLLKAQRKVVRQEKIMRIEQERKRLSLILQVQYVLHSLKREDVRRNFCNTRQHSRYLTTHDMESLLDLASLLGCKRDHSMSLLMWHCLPVVSCFSLEDQMEQAAIVYWELLEGNEKPVAGSTWGLIVTDGAVRVQSQTVLILNVTAVVSSDKHMKDKLLQLVDCGFFDHIPLPKVDSPEKTEAKADPPSRPCSLSALVKLSSKEVPSKEKQSEGFTSPPLYRRGSSISIPLENQSTVQTGKQPLCNGVSTSVSEQTFSTPPSHRSISAENTFHNIHSVFNVASLPISESSGMKSDESGFSESMHLSYTSAKTQSYSTASTQTPPELNPPEDDLQTGGYEAYRVNVRSPGGGFISQTHTTHRDPGSAFYVSRENGYQQSFKRGGGTATQRSSAGWSDSSQVSSPDREGAYPLDSGISETLSIPPMEVPITPQGPHTLMPVHLYPLTQLRVAFSAARTANFAPGTLDQPIAFDLLHTNLGEMFDTITGRFTCPAPGAYVFIFHILKLAISVPLYINLMRNEEVMVSAYANDGAPDHETASNHAVLPLFQGDQVWLRLHRGAIYGSSWKYSTFSGFLLYQD
ncbi:Caprin-2 [Anabarilius grahami]|uniref:Caprin-2 n=1 Tax=Anabarilius grahami TaxID=495550 RepID=A0A3N0XDN9_ANAGA|nr:Caprin-2 [Anabarilius grahami]